MRGSAGVRARPDAHRHLQSAGDDFGSTLAEAPREQFPRPPADVGNENARPMGTGPDCAFEQDVVMTVPGYVADLDPTMGAELEPAPVHETPPIRRNSPPDQEAALWPGVRIAGPPDLAPPGYGGLVGRTAWRAQPFHLGFRELRSKLFEPRRGGVQVGRELPGLEADRRRPRLFRLEEPRAGGPLGSRQDGDLVQAADLDDVTLVAPTDADETLVDAYNDAARDASNRV